MEYTTDTIISLSTLFEKRLRIYLSIKNMETPTDRLNKIKYSVLYLEIRENSIEITKVDKNKNNICSVFPPTKEILSKTISMFFIV